MDVECRTAATAARDIERPRLRLIRDRERPRLQLVTSNTAAAAARDLQWPPLRIWMSNTAATAATYGGRTAAAVDAQTPVLEFARRQELRHACPSGPTTSFMCFSRNMKHAPFFWSGLAFAKSVPYLKLDPTAIHLSSLNFSTLDVIFEPFFVACKDDGLP